MVIRGGQTNACSIDGQRCGENACRRYGSHFRHYLHGQGCGTSKTGGTPGQGHALPVDLKGQILYYVGPAPAKPGQAIGSAGPTTSGRMDPILLLSCNMGLKLSLAKEAAARKSAEPCRILKEFIWRDRRSRCPSGKKILAAEIVAYPELGRSYPPPGGKGLSCHGN